MENAEFPADPKKIQDIFLHPKVTDNYSIDWKEPNMEKIVDFLYREKDFSEDRVRKALERMQEGTKKAKGKTTLEKWFV